MVSKAKEDFPEPESPVMVTNSFLGILTLMFLRLCSLAPYISMYSFSVLIMSISSKKSRLTKIRNYSLKKFINCKISTQKKNLKFEVLVNILSKDLQSFFV